MKGLRAPPMSGRGSRPGEVIASEHSDQDAVGVRDHDAGQILVAHPPCDRFQTGAWPDRARSKGHRVFRGHALTGTQSASAEVAQDDAFFVRDDAGPPVVRQAFSDVRDELVWPACRRVRTDKVSDACMTPGLSFEREPKRAPVGLAGEVDVNAGEADVFEPPRGSWAQVSLVVVAVGDHRPLAIESGGRVSVERLQRDVDRAGKVLVSEFACRKNLDELRLLLADEALNFGAVDRGRHFGSLARSVVVRL
jgi:hypothetical protein